MRSDNGSGILPPNDPRVNNIGIIHVQPDDSRQDLLTQINLLSMQGRTHIAIVLEEGQRALKEGVSFEGLSQAKWKHPVALAIVAPPGSEQEKLAQKYHFPVYSDLRNLAAGAPPRQQNSMPRPGYGTTPQPGYNASLQPGYIPPRPASNKPLATQMPGPQQQLPPSFQEAIRPVKEFLKNAFLRKQNESPDRLFSTDKIAHDIGCEPRLTGQLAMLQCAGGGFRKDSTGYYTLDNFEGLYNEMSRCHEAIGFQVSSPDEAKMYLRYALANLVTNKGIVERTEEEGMVNMRIQDVELRSDGMHISQEYAATANALFDKEARRNAMDLMAYNSGPRPNVPVTPLHQRGKPESPQKS